MPSLTVPRRRPFSDVGKSLGKLKIMVAGKSGIGKTSLIKTLAQRCEHIVHMDPIEHGSAVHATETYASSRPHPWWRSDSDLTGSWPDLHYLESHLAPIMSKPLDDSDLLALVTSGGEPVVDVLLYLIPHSGLEREDVEYIKHAQVMTNVIPVLTRADELAPEEVEHIRHRVVQNLADADVEYFSFDGPSPSDESSPVYVISTESRPDYDNMDATVLMNSEYLPPLVPTDLSRLVEHIFSLDGSARLRHSAAVKCVKWRREHGNSLLQSALSSGCMVSRAIPQRALRLRSFKGSQSWEPLELYNWANTLRQSLHSERLHHLVEERSNSDTPPHGLSLVRIGADDEQRAGRKSKKSTKSTHQDPLGLLEFGGKLKQNGMLALEMVSSLGLIGLVISKIIHSNWSEAACSTGFAGTRRVGMELGQLSTLLSL
ncbi:hypothetical protein ACJ41O_011417 [Fusarium nematophilum]